LDIATLHWFDPLVADNWYFFPIKNILSTKGGTAVLSRYRWSLGSCLINLFPDIGLERENFGPKHFPILKINRVRQYLKKIADSKGFYVFDFAKWNQVSLQDILVDKEGRWVLRQFGGSLQRSLSVIGYPTRMANL